MTDTDDTTHDAAWRAGYDRGYAVRSRMAEHVEYHRGSAWRNGYAWGFGSATIGFFLAVWIVPLVVR